VPSTETPDHHGSHRDLLWSAGDPSTQNEIDAIIVPTARRPAALEKAADLAVALQCTLVTLHSKEWTNAAKAAQRLPRSVDLVAVDVPDPAQLRLPNWETSRQLARTVFAPRTDLSAKRNLGLVLSRLLGWKRVLFLDDDITGLDPSDVREASGLLDTHNAVGLHVGGFSDNSVVCHAYRQAGGRQQSFIGGGALAVQVERNNSFFPNIYNDDWFFLLDGDKGLQPVAVAGQVTQQPYYPFRPERARAEEFGDVLAEGLYWLLDQNRSITDANKDHWASFLVRRRHFIGHVLGMVREDQALQRDEKARRVGALKASLESLAIVTPERCENYLRAWRADRQRWHRHLQKLPSGYIQQHPQHEQRLLALAALSRPGSPRLKWRLGAQGVRSATHIPLTGAPPGRLSARPLGQLTAADRRRRPASSVR
jgi:hypothetical protein